jgi:GT2 family glycosyltransferase
MTEPQDSDKLEEDSGRDSSHPMSSETTNIDTSIVLATCSRAKMLRDALESLLVQSWADDHAVEIVVVDDGSTDDTPELLREMQQRSPIPFIVVRGKSAGVAAARNLGGQTARGVWIASFDDDQIAQRDWLRDLHALAAEKNAACVGGALKLQLPESRRNENPGPRVRRVLGEHLLGDTPLRYSGKVFPATNNVLMRRSVFDALDGYDVSFTEGGEDTDFFKRASAAGNDLWFQPLSAGLHVMTEQRMERSNLRWTSLRLGASDARVHRRKHPLDVLWLVALRTTIAVWRDWPLWLFAKIRGDCRAELDVLCSQWYTEGLLRSFWPILRGHEERSAFLRSIDFRARNGERQGLTQRS